ncbi:MAG: YdeI/OmpD-associated family protein [Myxococcota bacterium]
MKINTYEKVEVADRRQWRHWLERNADREQGIWLVFFRRHHPQGLPWADVVREALCFGWIDSRPRKVDADRTSLLLTPRRKGSAWSALNKRYVAELERAGLIAERGRRVIEEAKADGSWTFLDDVEALEVPPDLSDALEARQARGFWDGFPDGSKKIALEWIKRAKRERTRRDRIERVADGAARNERVR